MAARAEQRNRRREYVRARQRRVAEMEAKKAKERGRGKNKKGRGGGGAGSGGGKKGGKKVEVKKKSRKSRVQYDDEENVYEISSDTTEEEEELGEQEDISFDDYESEIESVEKKLQERKDGVIRIQDMDARLKTMEVEKDQQTMV